MSKPYEHYWEYMARRLREAAAEDAKKASSSPSDFTWEERQASIERGKANSGE